MEKKKIEDLAEEMARTEREIKYLSLIKERMESSSAKGEMNEQEWVRFTQGTYLNAHAYELLQGEQLEEMGAIALTLNQTQNKLIEIGERVNSGENSPTAEEVKKLTSKMINETLILVVSLEAKEILEQIKNLELAISYKVGDYITFNKINSINQKIGNPMITLLCEGEIESFKQYLAGVVIGVEVIADYYDALLLNEVADKMINDIDRQTELIKIPLNAREYIEDLKADKEEYSERLEAAKNDFITKFLEPGRLNGLSLFFQYQFCRVAFGALPEDIDTGKVRNE